MKKNRTLWILGVICLFYTGQVLAETVVAKVGNREITLDDFKKRYAEVTQQTINPPNKEQFLEDLVRYEVGLQEAEKKNVRQNPIVQERIRQEIYKGLLETELSEQINKISVSEAEMKELYRKYPEVRTAHILIEFKGDSSPAEIAAAQKRAEEIYQEVKTAKRPFEDLVRLYTDDTFTKENGGDVGWQTSVTLSPEYYNAVINMKPGSVKGLIRTRYGLHIVKMLGIKSYARADKRQLRAAVFDQKRRVLFDNYFKNLKSQYKISVNKKLIE